VTILALFLLAYLFVAPDKGSLALTRGTAGAVRGLLGMGGSSRTAKKTAASTGRSGANGGRGASELKRSILDGWREGTASARQVREEGRDLWSRGTRVSGRVAGGTRNLVGGARTTIRNRRDRRNQTDVPDQDVSPIDVPTADPSPSADNDVHAGLKQHLDDSAEPAGPAGSPRQSDGELLFSSRNDDLGAVIGDPPPQPEPKASEMNEPGDQVVDDVPAAVAPEAEEPPADDRYYVWKSPDSGQFFMFDRMNLDEPLTAPTETDADLWAVFYNGRHALVTEHGFAATALTPFPAGSPASQTPGAAPATGNPTTSTTTRKETPMAIAGTELANIDEVDAEAKTALTAIETLIEALDEIKGWGGKLPERWAGTSWSTDGLDAAVSGVAEASAELQIPEGLMEKLALISAEVKKARTVGEVAAEARAKGDLSGFIPA
jgi:hypothetical protein